MLAKASKKKSAKGLHRLTRLNGANSCNYNLKVHRNEIFSVLKTGARAALDFNLVDVLIIFEESIVVVDLVDNARLARKGGQAQLLVLLPPRKPRHKIEIVSFQ